VSSVFGNILKKIYDALPTAKNPAIVRGMVQKWRDDFPGNSLSPNNWEIIQTSSGQSITVTNSELQINAGTVANSQTIIRSRNKLTIPCRVNFLYLLSQRIVNQEFYLELIDASGQHCARVLFSGTSLSTATSQVVNSGDAGAATVFNLGINSSVYSIMEFDIALSDVKLGSRTTETGSLRTGGSVKNRKIPDPTLEYFIQIRVVNSNVAPSSNTILYLDSISYEAIELLSTEIIGARGNNSGAEAIPVVAVSSVTVTGNINATITNNVQNTETTALIAANASFTGTARNAVSRPSLTITVQTDQSGTLFIEQSPDNALWLPFQQYNCVAGVNIFSATVSLTNCRIRYENGTTATGVFRIYSMQRL